MDTMDHNETSDSPEHDETHDRIVRQIWPLIQECEKHSDDQKVDRDRALEYYNGEMHDLQAQANRSSVVSKDVRGVIKKLMPSIMRTLLSNDKIVEYIPTNQETEAMAQQASDVINHVVVPECDAEKALKDAIFDALVVKTGILKWTAYQTKSVKVHDFSNQSEEQMVGLEGDGIELMDMEAVPETDEELLALDPDAQRYSFKLRRTEERTDIRLEALPRGSFLIYPSATDIETSPIVGERQVVTRSDLVARGFDRDEVNTIEAHTQADDDDGTDAEARQGEDFASTSDGNKVNAMDLVLVYEVYVRLDEDDDGIAELYKVTISDSGNDAQNRCLILSSEAVDEAPYADLVAERDAHQFEGHSVAEDVMDIQRIKTSLWRETLDNIYWQNAKQPAIDPSKLTNAGLDAVYNPAFGKPIELKAGADVRAAIQWMEVPLTATASMEMMNYMDEVLRDRTGITDRSGGLDPEALQNVAATTANIMSDSGLAQSEMVVHTLARGGLRKAFRGLLKLVIAHADKPRTFRLRKEWVEYDPRNWDVDMDCKVNTGLGAGSKERDMAVLQLVLNLQKELLATIGPDNPYVKPDQLFNVLEKMTEAAGFPSADPYFTRPDPAEVQKLMEGDQGPSDEEKKMQMQAQLKQAEAEAKKQIEEAQMQADVRVEEARMQANARIETLKAENSLRLAQMKEQGTNQRHAETLGFEREKFGLEQQTKIDEGMAQVQIEQDAPLDAAVPGALGVET